MKILFDNKALDAAITSETYSANYPPENLVHPFLRRRYQTTTGLDNITFTLPADASINSIYFGFHNAQDLSLITEEGDYLTTEDGLYLSLASADVSVKLYNLQNTLLYQKDGILLSQFEAFHFSTINLVRKIVISLDWGGISNVYLGGVGFGLSYTMPDPVANWASGVLDNSVVDSNLVGQYTQNYVEPQDTSAFNFFGVARETFDEIKANVKSVGVGRPVWVDFFEEGHAIMPPCYSVFGGLESVSNSKMVYAFQMKFTEAR